MYGPAVVARGNLLSGGRWVLYGTRVVKELHAYFFLPGGVSLSEVRASGVGRCLFSSGQRKARYFGAVRAIE
jgi:hypothetical protein